VSALRKAEVEAKAEAKAKEEYENYKRFWICKHLI